MNRVAVAAAGTAVLLISFAGAARSVGFAAAGSVARVAQVAAPAATKCSITAIVRSGGGVRATGRCVAGKRAATSAWTWTYVSADSVGVACGAKQAGKGSFAYSRSGPFAGYRTTVTYHLAAAGSTVSATKSATFVTGDRILSCADLGTVSLPSASTICAWDDPNYSSMISGPPFNTCGTEIIDKAGRYNCGWMTPATLAGNIVSSGRFACLGGACAFEPGRKGSTLFGTPVDTNQGYVCHRVPGVGSTVAIIVIGTVRLVDQAGQTCQWISYGNGPGNGTAGLHSIQFSSFTLPANLGGTFYVTFRLQAVFEPANAPITSGGEELETASFPLAGTGGCASFHP